MPLMNHRISALKKDIQDFKPGICTRAYRSPAKKIQKLISQLRSRFYVMNEAGGIAHTIPDHEKLIAFGTDGFVAEISARQRQVRDLSDAWHFYGALKASAAAFTSFCGRYETLALDAMDRTSDRQEQERLGAIAASLKTAPRKGAG